MFKTLMVALTALTALGTWAAQEPDSPSTGPDALGRLTWLEGSWFGEGLGGEVEEHWTAASGGTMIGSFRLVAEAQSKVIEYLMITREDERIVYRFKHYRGDYTTWEKEGPLEFTLIEVSDSVAVFHSEVPGQNSPRRLTYSRVADDALVVLVQGSDEQGNLDEGFEVRFKRRP